MLVQYLYCRKAAFQSLVMVWMGLFLCAYGEPAISQVVDNVIVNEQEQGYQLIIQFLIPLRYQSHSLHSSGRELQVQLRPELSADENNQSVLGDAYSLTWDKDSGIPLKDIFFDSENISSPVLLLRVSQNSRFRVRNGDDLSQVIIELQTQKPQRTDSLIASKVGDDPQNSPLLEQANQSMQAKDYGKAIQLYTKIIAEYGGELQQRAQELLGLAREYNGQLAHAKAEYEKYLDLYPQSEGATRVRQRLTALLTAFDKPKAKLQAAERQSTEGWRKEFYGSLGQTYFKDETTPEDEDALVLRSDLLTDLDFVVRARKGANDLRLQFAGSYRNELDDAAEQGNAFLPSILSLTASNTDNGLYGRFGRQSRTSGGVLGRFDGIHGAYEMNTVLTLNGVWGHPVDTADRQSINTDQEFHGLSLDISPPWDGWDFNSFYIKQTNAGVLDREAIGGEVRFFSAEKSFFHLIDYDVHFNALNIFLMSLNLGLSENTTFNWVLDIRKSPLLTTTNAIQGQGLETLAQLQGRYTQAELYQLAKDRTADSQSMTIGFTHQLDQYWQTINELTFTEMGETRASAGIEAVPGTGGEYYYSSQLIGNSVFYDNDSLLLGLRYSDSVNANTYSFNSSWRVYAKQKWRINPRLRLDYRSDKGDGDVRQLVKPSLRLDYRAKKWFKIEGDLGYEWVNEEFSGLAETSSSRFFSLGYRYQF